MGLGDSAKVVKKRPAGKIGNDEHGAKVVKKRPAGKTGMGMENETTVEVGKKFVKAKSSDENCQVEENGENSAVEVGMKFVKAKSSDGSKVVAKQQQQQQQQKQNQKQAMTNANNVGWEA